MNLKNELLTNIDEIHTTELGVKRIKNNLGLDDDNVVEYCNEILKNEKSTGDNKGKNYDVYYNDIILTINSSSFTIITAHRT